MRSVQALLAALPIAAAGAASGTLDVLSMNVAGLPPIFNGNDVPGDKKTNSQMIGSLFAKYGYDIIHVQEDFNFHANIYETDNHPYRTATSGGVPFGSGLNTLANFPWVDYRRIKWNVCSNSSGADCLTPKGFTFMRLRVDEGVYIDVYNLHTDAGSNDDDMKARNSNLRQVSDYIKVWSKGNAVMVFGDTNSRYSRIPDGIRMFGQDNGLLDPWVDLTRNGVIPTEESLCNNPSKIASCETVDKLFYRGNPILSLNATDYRYDSPRFLQPNGDLLTDHNPIGIDLNWVLSPDLRQSDLAGGPHGDWFSDVPTLAGIQKPRVSQVILRGDARIDSVGVKLTDGTTFTHGGTGGKDTVLTLNQDEFWTSAEVCQAKYKDRTRIFFMSATTSSGRTISSGARTGDCNAFKAGDGWHIVGFNGQSGDGVDQLAVIYARK